MYLFLFFCFDIMSFFVNNYGANLHKISDIHTGTRKNIINYTYYHIFTVIHFGEDS